MIKNSTVSRNIYRNSFNPRLDTNEDNEFAKQMQSLHHLHYFENSVSFNQLQIFLDHEIREPAYYRMVIQRLLSLSENDEVTIILNTPGGILDSTISIINAMRYCPGEVTCVIDNFAGSAGSLIALASPRLIIAPNATMFIHNYSAGAAGKGGDIMNQVNFNDTQIRKLMTEIYQGFLTKAELDQLFLGRDFWFDSDEIAQRLESRNKYQAKVIKKAAKAKQNVPEGTADGTT